MLQRNPIVAGPNVVVKGQSNQEIPSYRRLLFLAYPLLFLAPFSSSFPSLPRSFRDAIHQQPLDAVACCPLLPLLMCALLVTSSHSEGPPYLPAVTGNTHCPPDRTDPACTAAGTCISCYTFNEADVVRPSLISNLLILCQNGCYSLKTMPTLLISCSVPAMSVC